MVGRVFTYIMFACLVVALVLSFAGITEVYIGNGFTNWLRFTTDKFNSWSFKIPKIPNVKLLGTAAQTGSNEQPLDFNGDGNTTVGEFFGWLNSKESVPSKILNSVIMFFNFIINLVNLLIQLINVVVQVFQFVLTMVYCVKDLPQYLRNSEWLHWNNEESIWWWKNLTFVARTIV